MPKFNDLDLNNWKEIDLDMNSLWVIPGERNIYNWFINKLNIMYKIL